MLFVRSHRQHPRLACLVLLVAAAVCVCPTALAQNTLLSAVLPVGRSVQVNVPATAFLSVVNPGLEAVTGCVVAPATALPIEFHYQTTDPLTNLPIGSQDAAFDVASGATVSFVFSMTSAQAIAPTEIGLNVQCDNATSPAPMPGLNMFSLSVTEDAQLDIVAVAGTATNDGVVHLSGDTKRGAFVVAVSNLGATGSSDVTAEFTGSTPGVEINVCETDPVTSVCLQPPEQSIVSTLAANGAATYGVFVTGQNIASDPANNRIKLVFSDSQGVARAGTAVGVMSGPVFIRYVERVSHTTAYGDTATVDLGLWMFKQPSVEYDSIANWLNSKHNNRDLLEPVNVLWLDFVSSSVEESEQRVSDFLDANFFFREFFKHSPLPPAPPYRALVQDQGVFKWQEMCCSDQARATWVDTEWPAENNHGRIFPSFEAYNSGVYPVFVTPGAFSRETAIFHNFDGFNVARDALKVRDTPWIKLPLMSLSNQVHTALFSTADHNGTRVFVLYPLKVSIVAPDQGTVYEEGELAIFDARAVNGDGQLAADATYEWFSNQDGPIGDGQSILTDELSVGLHRIKVIASDDRGYEAEAQIEVVVSRPQVDPWRPEEQAYLSVWPVNEEILEVKWRFPPGYHYQLWGWARRTQALGDIWSPIVGTQENIGRFYARDGLGEKWCLAMTATEEPPSVSHPYPNYPFPEEIKAVAFASHTGFNEYTQCITHVLSD